MKRLNRFINPISIIAVFAALSEASATTVLPYLDDDNRQIYIWFLIAFPSALVILFFLTLNFNNKVLYNPYSVSTHHLSEEQGTDLPLSVNTEPKSQGIETPSPGQPRQEFICRKN